MLSTEQRAGRRSDLVITLALLAAEAQQARG
jgi:hypothetical protein